MIHRYLSNQAKGTLTIDHIRDVSFSLSPMGISSSQDATVRFTDLPWIHHRSLVTDNLQRFTQAEISHLFQHRARNRFPDDLQHLFIDEQHFQVTHDSIFKGISHSSLPKGNWENYQFMLVSNFADSDGNRRHSIQRKRTK